MQHNGKSATSETSETLNRLTSKWGYEYEGA